MTPPGGEPRPPLRWPERWPTAGPVRLRPWRDDDLATVADLARDPYVPLIGSVPAVPGAEAGRAYVARQHDRLATGTGWSFAVALTTTDRAVGGAGLWPQGEGLARAGYATAPADRGHGYAAAALRALVVFAAEVGVRDVELLVETGNLASCAVARRCGFVEVERLPQHLLVGGVRRDAVRYRRRVPPPPAQGR